MKRASAVAWAYRQNLPLGPKFALVVLAQYADRNRSDQCFPGQAAVAEAIGCSERSVRSYMAELEARGLIERHQRRRKDGTRSSDEYRLRRDHQAANLAAGQAAESAGSQPATSAGSTGGKSRHSNRQISPQQPAKSAGHEVDLEVLHPEDLQPEDLPPIIPPQPATAAAAAPAAQPSPELATVEAAEIDQAEDPPEKADALPYQAMLDTYNALRGPLPKVKFLTDERKRLLARAVKNLPRRRGEPPPDPVAWVADATQAVAHDDFWVRSRYNLDNLLAKAGRVAQYAERWQEAGPELGMSDGDRELAMLAKQAAEIGRRHRHE